MKKKITLFILITIALVMPLMGVKAQTLGELEKELNKKQQELNENQQQQNQNQTEINNTQQKINNIYSQMANITTEIDNKTKESEQLEKDIVEKNKQIEDLMRYYQVSTSGSSMLEYIMGAESITDLIYRLSITEQISNYNKKSIKQMNEMIKENEKIKEDLDNKKKELSKLQTDLSVQLAELNKTKSSLSEEGHSLSESIKEMQNTLADFKKLGCKSNETLTQCANRVQVIPSGSTFYRPTATGRITSNFGYRPSFGSYHYAVDIGVGIGTPVYSVASGTVMKVIYSNKGGGNQIIVHHKVNGKYYTSYYCHLSAINVKKGDVVTKNTVIGKSGNTGNSTGPHLHLGIATGRWYVDYYNYYGSNSFGSHAINPRDVIIFPSGSKSWSNR